MVTEDEKKEIIDLAVEKTLLMIPEVVGNLITNHMAMSKINSEFYAKHPEFKNKKDIVVSVIEMMEGKDPTLGHQEILEKAIPEIKNRIEMTKNLNISNVSSDVNRDFGSFTPHGEL